MQIMFQNCTKLTTLDLSSFTCEKLVNTGSMFSGCSNLKTIYADYEFDCRNVTTSTGMFTGCSKLVGGYGTSFAANSASSNADIKENAANCTYAVIDLKLAQEQDVLQSTEGYFTHSVLTDSADKAILTTGSKFNAAYKSLAGSTNITSIVFGKLSDYNLSGGTNIDAAGTGSIKMIKSGNTIYVLSNSTICFNPASDYMFQNITTVTNITFNNIDTGAVRTMQRFFEGCTKLTNLDLSSFDTRNVLDFGGFLRYCDGITSANAAQIVKDVETGKARDIGGFFSGCDGLTGALDLSGLTCPKAETIASLISECPNITSVNISGMTKPSSLYNASGMFSNCKNLKTIYTNSSFNLSGLPTTSPATGGTINASIFDGCTSLVGGNGTKFTTAQVGRAYARPDASGSPGYFTSYSLPASLSLFAMAPLSTPQAPAAPLSAPTALMPSGLLLPTTESDDDDSGSNVSGSISDSDVVSTTTTTTAAVTTTAAATTTAAKTTTAETTATTAASTTAETTTSASATTSAAETTTVSDETVTTTAAASEAEATSTSAAVTTTTTAVETTSTAAETTIAATTITTTAASTTAATTTAAPAPAATTTAATTVSAE